MLHHFLKIHISSIHNPRIFSIKSPFHIRNIFYVIQKLTQTQQQKEVNVVSQSIIFFFCSGKLQSNSKMKAISIWRFQDIKSILRELYHAKTAEDCVDFVEIWILFGQSEKDVTMDPKSEIDWSPKIRLPLADKTNRETKVRETLRRKDSESFRRTKFKFS